MNGRLRWLATVFSALSLSISGCVTAIHARGNQIDTVPHIRDKWALLIGVDRFQDPAVARNKEAAINVEILDKVLESPTAGKFTPGHVQILRGKYATADSITYVTTNWLAKKALPDDLIFVYVCSVANGNAQGEPELYSFDTLGSEPERSAINLREFLADLKRRTQSRYIVCALDTSVAPGSKGVDLNVLADTGVTILSATDGHQKSLNNGVTGTSVFVHHLDEALSIENGGFTIDRIFDHVSRNVSNDAETAFKTHQTPILIAADRMLVEQLELGTLPKAVHQPISFGHPLNSLAFDHPEIIPPLMGDDTGKPLNASKAHQFLKPTLVADSSKNKDDNEDAPPKHVDFGPYMDKMKADIQKHWSPPKGLENRQIVAVFTIMQDGRVIDAHVTEGTGIAEVDQAALDALKAASPLDPLPPGSPDSVNMKYKFVWQVKQD
jgi:TonB family protein